MNKVRILNYIQNIKYSHSLIQGKEEAHYHIVFIIISIYKDMHRELYGEVFTTFQEPLETLAYILEDIVRIEEELQ